MQFSPTLPRKHLTSDHLCVNKHYESCYRIQNSVEKFYGKFRKLTIAWNKTGNFIVVILTKTGCTLTRKQKWTCECKRVMYRCSCVLQVDAKPFCSLSVVNNFTLIFVITTYKRSLGQGNIFTSVCQSFWSRGGVYLWVFEGAVCLWVWGAISVSGSGDGVSTSGSVWGGATYTPWTHTLQTHTFLDPHPPRSTSEWYASYWNAFLFQVNFSIFWVN